MSGAASKGQVGDQQCLVGPPTIAGECGVNRSRVCGAPRPAAPRWCAGTAGLTPEEGATEHIGLDHLPLVSRFIADWVADTFTELAAKVDES